MNNVRHPSLEELAQFPLLSGLDETEAKRVLGKARIVTVDRGEHLFHHGNPARRTWLCRKGQLKLFRLSGSGQEKIMAIINPGRSFAEATLFMPRRVYPVHCAALKPSELVGFDADDLVETLHNDPKACFRLLGTLSRRMHEKINQIDSLSLQNAHLRVAHYLLEEYRRRNEPKTFRLEASKKHIAGLLAVQPETLSRSLTALQREGAIEMDARYITIHDAVKLESIARGTLTAPH
ncbi:Crp/Fnr family transcriptional regulator [Wenzhouxiangella sp. EGI_FJ10305]|uniref:Crp/Fnr family transcriptional regulator n=1 Tax=Wenzhouxiangella sp. EGI_FJ10305 TaxID=3243768 RepID=UPI0035DEA1C5